MSKIKITSKNAWHNTIILRDGKDISIYTSDIIIKIKVGSFTIVQFDEYKEKTTKKYKIKNLKVEFDLDGEIL